MTLSSLPQPLPCPFCGEIPSRASDSGHGKFSVGCNSVDCDTSPSTGHHVSAEAATEAWNRRSPSETAPDTKREEDIATVAGFIASWWPGLESGINWGGNEESDPVYQAALRLVPRDTEPTE